MDERTTKNLENILFKIDSEKEMEAFFQNPKVANSDISLNEYLNSLPPFRRLTDSDLIQLSGIEKSYYYQIRKGTKKPSRDKILRLCIAAGLSVKETTRALELSGVAILYPKNRRDIIITVAINQKQNVMDANILLCRYGEEPLS